LVISLLGSNDRMSLENWFTGVHTVGKVAVAGGGTLDTAGVATLVNAMAGFSSGTGVATGTVDSRRLPATVQTAIAQAWRTSA
jgi:hypothetical protein